MLGTVDLPTVDLILAIDLISNMTTEITRRGSAIACRIVLGFLPLSHSISDVNLSAPILAIAMSQWPRFLSLYYLNMSAFDSICRGSLIGVLFRLYFKSASWTISMRFSFINPFMPFFEGFASFGKDKRATSFCDNFCIRGLF